MGDENPVQTNTNSSRCTFFNDEHQCDVILKVKRATGTFSIVACSLMLFAIWLLRRYNSLAQKMVVSLTIAALFDSVAYVMAESHPEGSLCNFQAWWLTYFDWTALVWVCLITFNLYLNLVREIRTEHCERLYHVFAWGVPLVMSTIPLVAGYYGPAGAWCWITDDHVGWRFGIWYIPLFSLIALMICCYARIICVANERMHSWLGTFNPEQERRKMSLAEEIRPLKWYPSVYLLVSLFPLINRLHNAAFPKDPVFSLTLLHVLSAPLHGFVNAFVFGKDTWSQLSTTGIKMAIQSRLCDSTRIGEYHAANVRYTHDFNTHSDSDDEDNNILFYSPDMKLQDREPWEKVYSAFNCDWLEVRHVMKQPINDEDVVSAMRNVTEAIPGAYVVRKIRSSLTDEEQKDQPVLTPCRLAKGKKEKNAAALMEAPEPQGAAAPSESTETAVQKWEIHPTRPSGTSSQSVSISQNICNQEDVSWLGIHRRQIVVVLKDVLHTEIGQNIQKAIQPETKEREDLSSGSEPLNSSLKPSESSEEFSDPSSPKESDLPQAVLKSEIWPNEIELHTFERNAVILVEGSPERDEVCSGSGCSSSSPIGAWCCPSKGNVNNLPSVEEKKEEQESRTSAPEVHLPRDGEVEQEPEGTRESVLCLSVGIDGQIPIKRSRMDCVSTEQEQNGFASEGPLRWSLHTDSSHFETSEPIVLSSEDEKEEEEENAMFVLKAQPPEGAKESAQIQMFDLFEQSKFGTDIAVHSAEIQLRLSSLHMGGVSISSGDIMTIAPDKVSFSLRAESSRCVLLCLAEPITSIEIELLASLMDLVALKMNRQEVFISLTELQSMDLLQSSQETHLLQLLKPTLEDEQESDDLKPIYSLHHRRTQGSYSVSLAPIPGPEWRPYTHCGPTRSNGDRQGFMKLFHKTLFRLIQFPPPPTKGAITVTTEDLKCLDSGVFLNDVIIDFYLKYLLVQKAPQASVERSHVFSSFFYKQLTRRDHANEDNTNTPAQVRRHQRVRTWTRHVDIFEKDFLFVPVNQEAHWYLVVVCFPGLRDPQYVKWDSGDSEQSDRGNVLNESEAKIHAELRINNEEDKGTDDSQIKSSANPLPPNCTEKTCKNPIVWRRYLEEEWAAKRGSSRDFSAKHVVDSFCRVPQQDNSSDCGLYLLQYAESFLQDPVVHFDLPLRLELWFPRQQVRGKREEIRDLILHLYRFQQGSSGHNALEDTIDCSSSIL
ncbi:hypothetical protein DNTS_026889 [Danionella cerebrum]|uniref:G-protein coupled receptors family 2 profile 2 domain-containing protein n=1 Tax=Danionella cerebrum TaxID=2873325 RepID=A0A553QE56_9TELE|nr:hypothetical protein DNTS_026889 [Danionella translucida]